MGVFDKNFDECVFSLRFSWFVRCLDFGSNKLIYFHFYPFTERRILMLSDCWSPYLNFMTYLFDGYSKSKKVLPSQNNIFYDSHSTNTIPIIFNYKISRIKIMLSPRLVAPGTQILKDVEWSGQMQSKHCIQILHMPKFAVVVIPLQAFRHQK